MVAVVEGLLGGNIHEYGRARMNTLEVALIQMRCEKGAIDRNLAATQQYLQQAAGRRVDIACFPEMSITGYIDPNRQPEAVLRLDGPEVERFLQITSGTAYISPWPPRPAAQSTKTFPAAATSLGRTAAASRRRPTGRKASCTRVSV